MSELVGLDYESARWGEGRVRPGEWSIAGFRLAEALVHLPRSGRLLEVGCGAGRYLRSLRALHPGLSLVGADVSAAALARLAELDGGIETRRVTGEKLPGTDAEFDAVLLIDVLEHLVDPSAALREVARVLVPGGVLHLHVPCEGDARSLWRWLPGQAGARGLKRRLGGHLQRFRRADVLAQLRALGFEVLRVRNSLHVLGNAADVALFLWLAFRHRGGEPTLTSGDVVASGPAWVRAVDALVYWEARALARLPSWSIHVTARWPGSPRGRST